MKNQVAVRSMLIPAICLIALSSGYAQSVQGHEAKDGDNSGPLVHQSAAPTTKDIKEYVATGAVFTRWGRTVCPSDATLVYRGVMGGTASTYKAGGNEYLCLTDKPEWGKDGTSDYTGIWGVEYKSGEELFNKDNAEKLINHDAVCAVCRSARSVQVMIPGRKSCMEGWTREYYGYLMTASDENEEGSKSYVCIDHAPEADKAGYEDKGGATLYPVGAECGSLPCPGYIYRKRLTCVVCSQ